MGKANISFPDGLLEEVDRRAAAAGTSRSGFIQEATARYIARLDADAGSRARSDRILAAMHAAADVGGRMAPGPDGDTLIRRLRDEPPAWLPTAEGDRER